MRITRCQIAMGSTVEENLVALERGLAAAAREAADLALFPELSLTGFHRGVPALCETSAIEDALRLARGRCADRAIAALVGVPRRNAEGGLENGMVGIDALGDVRHLQAKVGLTPSEARLFVAAGETTPWSFRGARLAVMLCREALELDRFARLAGRIEALLWPSYVQWGAGQDDYLEAARAIARAAGAWVIQANWSTAVNEPGLRGLGGSLVVDPTGEVVDVAPEDAESIATFELSSA